MSASDEAPPTLPPPAGEDDAYNAATKVGSMPADLMAKLRAEGLLPEAAEDAAAPSEPKPRPPHPAAVNLPNDGVVPTLYSTKPPPGAGSEPPDAEVAAPIIVETPIAFAGPSLPPEAAAPPDAEPSAVVAAPPAPRAKRRGMTVLTVAMIAVVALLFAMALLRQRG